MMAAIIPDPDRLHPVEGQPRVVMLKPLTRDVPHIEAGDFSYYDDPHDPLGFADNNVLYSYGNEKLVIGKYCAIATGTTFIMAGADHPMLGVSTFPFTIYGGTWAEKTLDVLTNMATRGDTVVGNDVWFGYRAMVMPGVRIGDGAIIASGAVVTSDVAPYTIVGGNPATPIRTRFDDAEVALLQRAAWWDWPAALVTEHARDIMTGTPARVAAIAQAHGLLAEP